MAFRSAVSGACAPKGITAKSNKKTTKAFLYLRTIALPVFALIRLIGMNRPTGYRRPSVRRPRLPKRFKNGPVFMRRLLRAKAPRIHQGFEAPGDPAAPEDCEALSQRL